MTDSKPEPIAADSLEVVIEVDVFNDTGQPLTPREWAERGWDAIRDLEAPIIGLRNKATGEGFTFDLETGESNSW